MSGFYTPDMIEFINKLREEGYSWPEVEKEFHEKYGVRKSHDTLRITAKNWSIEYVDEEDEDEEYIHIPARQRRSDDLPSYLIYEPKTYPKLKAKKKGTALLIPDCVPLDTTEVLTKSGWKWLRDLEAGEEIMAADHEANLFWDVPTHIHKQAPRPVHKFKRGNVVLEATSGHRNMFVNCNGSIIPRTTESLVGKNANLKASGTFTGEGESIGTAVAYLLGFIIGDGTRDIDNWKINIKKDRKVAILQGVASELDGLITENGPDKKGYYQFRARASLTKILDPFFGDYKKINFDQFLSLSYSEMRATLNGIIDSDGARKKDRPNIQISSVKEEHIILVQTLAHLTGVSAIRGKSQDNSKSTFPSDKPLHNVTLSDNKYGTYLGKFTEETRLVEVGCVTMPTDAFLMRQNGNISLTFNCHIPYADQRAYDLMLDVAKDVNDLAEIVILGDYADFYAVNSHGKHPQFNHVLASEVTQVRKELERLCKLFPNTKKVFIQGNHEYRLERYIYDKCPELFGIADTRSILKLDELGYEFVEYGPNQKYSVLGSKLYARHEPIGGGAHAAFGTVAKAGCSIIYGHVHKIQQYRSVFIDGADHMAASVGWLGNKNHPVMQYVKSHPQWQLGFALAHVVESGNFFLDIKHIIDYTTVHNGKIYRR